MGGDMESTQVTAGLAGFVVLFCLAVACWFLFRSMNNHLRKVKWREEREQRERAEAEAKKSAPSDRRDDTEPPQD